MLHDKQPRQISFTSTCQYVIASWTPMSCGTMTPMKIMEHCLRLFEQIASCEVANRPGRLEPRVLKRRTQTYPLMKNKIRTQGRIAKTRHLNTLTFRQCYSPVHTSGPGSKSIRPYTLDLAFSRRS